MLVDDSKWKKKWARFFPSTDMRLWSELVLNIGEKMALNDKYRRNSLEGMTGI